VRKLSPRARRAAGSWPQQTRQACALALTALVLLAASPLTALSQTAYRYRDANGQWVFTDQAPVSAAPDGDAITLAREHEALHVTLGRTDTPEATRLIAHNNCVCVVTLRVSIVRSDFADLPVGATYRATLEPGAEQMVAQARRTPERGGTLNFSWRGAVGAPDAVHKPTRLYRAPFAVGATFMVTQAYPTRATHDTAESMYAVDFGLPDGTPVYAAREGTVINVRHDSFSGAALPQMIDQANVILVLHDDGTIGVYAHLHWDSIRVRIGQHVQRGEYIANSGNTGFSTGPHLHFAVVRNSGIEDVSLPVQFEGPGGAAVTAVTSEPVTAY
jgi:murein DD-endopeptidase MepM/ murein hydrolase activator NlpD